ncbi:hypothetical protein BOX15_Mlig002108g2 [Macrostomum lignano]|uniref:SH2 domain-containing protein n=1 Tax=Macrostomum lignano TaxID=282301 RepID=A0A267DGD2_9PLAT|nr:hypothetical protein BOX15_Mlig002108g2 [Macrostomum lignano]
MDSAALKARLKNLSVYSLSRVAPQSGQGKGGYICRLQTRPSNSLQQEDPFFSIHWAVLQSDCLLLFDSSISRSCSEAIYLSGFSLEDSPHPEGLWPDFCGQRFQLSGPDGAVTWHLGCEPGSNWQHQLRVAIVAATLNGGGGGGLARLLDAADAPAGSRLSRPPPPPVPTAAAAATMATTADSTYNEASSESPKTTSVAAPSTPLWLPPPPPPVPPPQPLQQPLQQHQQSSRSSTAVHSIYDRCSTPPPEEQQPQTLHNLVCRGLTVSFALDYVATAVCTEPEADEDTLWHVLSETDPGTFLLAGYSRDQPASCNQIAVKTSTGFGVECLSIVTMPQTGVALVGEFGGTFDTLEQLVFHYHLHPIVRDESGTTVHLSQAYGYENSQRIPVLTMLFSSCLWTIGDKEMCSKVLFESTQGTYSLRAGADSNYVLSVRSQNIVAKLVIRVDKQSDCKNQFYLANSGPSGIVKYDSLEDLLVSLHSSRFPVTVSKNKILTTLQTPYQNSKACKAKQQSLLLDPLRQRIFHRGQEDQAVRALRLPSTQSGAFVVWLTSATEVSLMVRGQGQRVLSFKVVCTPTGCRALPERAVYLEKLPELKFDSIESLVAHLQCNPDLLMPELPGRLTQPISCRNL